MADRDYTTIEDLKLTDATILGYIRDSSVRPELTSTELRVKVGGRGIKITCSRTSKRLSCLLDSGKRMRDDWRPGLY